MNSRVKPNTAVLLSIIFLSLVITTASAAPTDVLYVRDGSRIEGTVMEIVPGKTVKIRSLNDGKIYVYMVKDIKKMDIDPSSGVQLANVNASAADAPPPLALPHKAWSVAIGGGASVPVGAFAATSGTEMGMATTGWAGVLEGSLALVPGVDLAATSAIAINSLDFSQINANGFIVLSDVGSWRSLWALTGLKAYTAVASGTELYGTGEAGMFFGRTYSVDATPGKNSRGAAFGWGLAAGIRTGFLEFSVRYLRANPEYESARPLIGTTKYWYFRQPTACLMLTGAFVL